MMEIISLWVFEMKDGKGMKPEELFADTLSHYLPEWQRICCDTQAYRTLANSYLAWSKEKSKEVQKELRQVFEHSRDTFNHMCDTDQRAISEKNRISDREMRIAKEIEYKTLYRKEIEATKNKG